jgi:hypothetical protein
MTSTLWLRAQHDVQRRLLPLQLELSAARGRGSLSIRGVGLRRFVAPGRSGVMEGDGSS